MAMRHGWNALWGSAALLLGAIVLTVVPKKAKPPEAELETPVPIQEFTPADAGVIVLPTMRVVIGRLPSPGPNQKKPEHCDPELGEEAINNGCWMRTDVPPPCPRGKLWEHRDACWRPVAYAKPPPTSGDPRRPGGVAGP